MSPRPGIRTWQSMLNTQPPYEAPIALNEVLTNAMVLMANGA